MIPIILALGDACLARGDERRHFNLEEMMIMMVNQIDHPDSQQLLTLAIAKWESKANKTGRLQYSHAARHKDVRVCVVGMLALYFFSRSVSS